MPRLQILKGRKIRALLFSVHLLCTCASEYVSTIPKFCHCVFFFTLFLDLEFLSNCTRLYVSQSSWSCLPGLRRPVLQLPSLCGSKYNLRDLLPTWIFSLTPQSKAGMGITCDRGGLLFCPPFICTQPDFRAAEQLRQRCFMIAAFQYALDYPFKNGCLQNLA